MPAPCAQHIPNRRFYARGDCSGFSLYLPCSLRGHYYPRHACSRSQINMANSQHTVCPFLQEMARGQLLGSSRVARCVCYPGAGPVDLIPFWVFTPSLFESQDRFEARISIKSTRPAGTIEKPPFRLTAAPFGGCWVGCRCSPDKKWVHAPHFRNCSRAIHQPNVWVPSGRTDRLYLLRQASSLMPWRQVGLPATARETVPATTLAAELCP